VPSPSLRPLLVLAAALAVLFPVAAGALGAPAVVPDPCLDRAPDAVPGTPEWAVRDAQNMACSEQRAVDAAARPPFLAPGTPSPAQDPYRHPSLHDGTRFRFAETVVINRAGVELPTEVYRPCTAASCTGTPDGVQVADGPYPAVVIVHGGASNKKLHWWAAQSLAEHGYLSVVFDVAENSGGDHGTDAQDVVDWLLSDRFPFAAEVDRQRVGIAGHSQGASTASLLGQLDPRLKAVVAWDNLTAVSPELWADDLGVDPPAGLPLTTPALGIGADYYFTPRPYAEAPEPAASNGEGGRGRGFRAHPKDLGYQELRAAGVDTMLVVLRAANHLDFTPLHAQPASRYGEAVSTYYTLAWFDRYLRGLTEPDVARDAHERLVATEFDDSADVHSISAGTWDPERGNVPHLVEGLSVCDRLSFYYRSRASITEPGTGRRVATEDARGDCYAGRIG
jgi:acetyl esterase/lipase